MSKLATILALILALLYSAPEKKKVIFVLSAEPRGQHVFGDPELVRNFTNEEVRIVSFNDLPWYVGAQESALEKQTAECGKWLDCYAIGFSKSGWGLLHFMQDHPYRFTKAAIFDAPLKMRVPKYEFPLQTVPALSYKSDNVFLIGCVTFCDDMGHVPRFSTHRWSGDWIKAALNEMGIAQECI